MLQHISLLLLLITISIQYIYTQSSSTTTTTVPDSSLSFTSNTYLVPTNVTTLQVGINRLGGTSGDVQTMINCIDETAIKGIDYNCNNNNNNIITWSNNDDTIKSFYINITQNIGKKYFMIMLNSSNTNNAFISSPYIAQIYINYCDLTGSNACSLYINDNSALGLHIINNNNNTITPNNNNNNNGSNLNHNYNNHLSISVIIGLVIGLGRM